MIKKKDCTYVDICKDLKVIFEPTCKHIWVDITPNDYDGYIYKCRKCGNTAMMSETCNLWFRKHKELGIDTLV